jgi:hypothetical protein
LLKPACSENVRRMETGTCYSVAPRDEPTPAGAVTAFTRGAADFDFEIDDATLSDLIARNPGETVVVTVQITHAPIGGVFVFQYEAFYAEGIVVGSAVVTSPDPRSGGQASVGQTIKIEVARI